jgi:hypothetical protein
LNKFQDGHVNDDKRRKMKRSKGARNGECRVENRARKEELNGVGESVEEGVDREEKGKMWDFGNGNGNGNERELEKKRKRIKNK